MGGPRWGEAMQFPFFAKTTAGFPLYSGVPGQGDLELGTLTGTSSRIELSAVAKNKNVFVRLLEAPPVPGEERRFGRLSPGAIKAPIGFRLKYMVVAGPVGFAAAWGATTLAANRALAGMDACRVGVCQRYGNATWPAINWDHSYPTVVGQGSGNLTATCVADFEAGVVRNNSFISFSWAGEQELCPVPYSASTGYQAWVSAIFGVAATASALAYTTYTRGRADIKSLAQAHAILFPDLLASVSQKGAAASSLTEAFSYNLLAAMRHAAIRGERGMVADLLALGVSPSRSGNSAFNQVLIAALAHRQSEIALLLAGRVTDVRAEDLKAAAHAADVPVFLRLLAAADDSTSNTSLSSSELLREMDGDLLFSFAAAKQLAPPGMAGVLNALQSDAARFVNYADEFGRSALHVATFWQRANQTEALAAAGATSLLQDRFQLTPPSMALGFVGLAAAQD